MVMSPLFDCGFSKSHRFMQMSTSNICGGLAYLFSQPSCAYQYIVLIREGEESP